MADRMLSLEETAAYLSLKAEEVEGLVKTGKLSAYKIGGTYLRFKYNQVAALKQKFGKKELLSNDEPQAVDRLKDFWYFNNFYIISVAIIVVLIILILM